MILHIFNPETDYALACGRKQYTPPKNVLNLRKNLFALPALFANAGDAILKLDEVTSISDYELLAIMNNVMIVSPNQLKYHHFDKIMPWGWNDALVNFLKRHGVSEKVLPTSCEINRIRELAHRKNTIPFLKCCCELLPELNISKFPQEIVDINKLAEWVENHDDGFLKAPWSSSGRGVLRIKDNKAEYIYNWAVGCIRTQGSVMAEEAWDKALDFASEWYINSDGNVKFCGLSIFETGEQGRYSYNICNSDDELFNQILTKSSIFSNKILDAQKIALQNILKGYEGPVGVDMLVDKCGMINPCVELNLRHTMGMASNALFRLFNKPISFNPLAFKLEQISD